MYYDEGKCQTRKKKMENVDMERKCEGGEKGYSAGRDVGMGDGCLNGKRN